MLRRINLVLMEADNARRDANRAGRPALHPLAEYYGDWERARDASKEEPDGGWVSVSLVAED